MSLSARHLNPDHAREVDPPIWKVCAGANSVHPPPRNSIVYYFPQGHAEHSIIESPRVFSPLVRSSPYIRCRVISVHHLVRSDTDELLVRIRLMPILDNEDAAVSELAVDDVTAEEQGLIRSSVKELTKTDMALTRLNIPLECVNTIFPNLVNGEYQELSMSDLQGNDWMFRRNRIGQSRLTNGWREFKDSKTLLTGDSLVFIRDDRITTTLHIGHKTNLHIGVRHKTNSERSDVRMFGMVPVDEVTEAASRAVAREEAFEIVYYPGGGFANFLVNAELVDSMWKNIQWELDVRVRMKMNKNVKGSVVAVGGYDDTGLWDKDSPWRMLQIHWDYPAYVDGWHSPWELQIDDVQPPFNINSGPATQRNNTGDTKTMEMFGQIIPFKRKRDGNG